MPLVKRAIMPVFVSRGELDKRVKNELEGVIVNSLAGVIKELSSLSKHADNLFGELFIEATNMYHRSAVLTQRVDDIYQHVRQMDSSVKDDGMSVCEARNGGVSTVIVKRVPCFSFVQSKWKISWR